MRRQREMKMKSLWYGEKGVRGESPIINSEACGECRESQGSPSKAQASRWRKRNKNREEIFPARERSEQGLKFPRFVAGEAFHTCAALSKANWRFAVEDNLLPTACKCPLWWGAGKPTGGGVVRYTRMTSSCFCCAKPLRRFANPHVFGYFWHQK